jgi:hypothetical protein
MKIGDLVKLKGFSLSSPNDIPHGLIIASLGLDKYKIKWLNDELATRWAVSVIMPSDKLELINSN